MKSAKISIVSTSLVFLLLIAFAFFFNAIYDSIKVEPTIYKSTIYNQPAQLNETEQPHDDDTNKKPDTKHLLNPPEILKAIYLTSWSGGSEKKIAYALNLAEETEINAVVVDVKDSRGYIAYDTDIPAAKKYASENKKIKDIDAMVEKFHEKDIYVIARIAVFRDPVLALSRPSIAIHSLRKKDSSPDGKLTKKTLWRDSSGIAWLDPSSQEVWDYNIAIAKDAYARGFDEINFDFIRFPSDGLLKDMVFPNWDGSTPKRDILQQLFIYLNKNMQDIRISGDLFGLSTINTDDLGIGQVIEDAFGEFDFISPMVYPSHYSNGFLGYKTPAEHPYEVVKYSMQKAQERLHSYKQQDMLKRETRIRPWLQDFSIRGVAYDATKVSAQIQATEEALGDSYAGYMLWNSRNLYTKTAIR